MLSITNSLELMTALFNAGLAFVILRGNWRNATNLLLGIYLMFLSLWALALIGTQIGDLYFLWLYSAKATYIAGLAIAASFYLFTIGFPENVVPKKWMILAVCTPVSLFSFVLLVVPTFLTQKIVHYSWGNGALLEPIAYFIFVGIFIYLYAGGLLRLWLKYFKTSGDTRARLLIIALGVTITGVSGTYFDIVLASPFLNQFEYIWTGPLLNTAMAVLITYAVFRFRLLNTKVIATEALIILLWIFTFLRTLLASDPREGLFNGLLFLLSLVIGTFLIRSVNKEVEQRELIEEQEKALQVVNAQQQNLLSFISHEIKEYFTKSEAVFASIIEEDFGATPPKLRDIAQAALIDARKGVATVMSILDASNMKKGAISFKKLPLDFRALVMKIIEEQRPAAYEKHLGFDVDIRDGAYNMTGDEEKLREHVVRNLIDNAIKYTPSGSIHIELSDGNRKIRFVVQDSGIGITPEDMSHLFTEGGHGKDSIKVNVHSTGYGLFIAKEVVDAHGGIIRAESEGAGKGSRFIAEFTV